MSLPSKEKTPYTKRLLRERELRGIAPNIRVKDYLSENMKTDYSINFPISNCTPTAACAKNCYACYGPIMYKNSLLKALSIENTLEKDLDYAVKTTAQEIVKKKLTNVRYSGGGELSENGIKYIDKLAEELPSIIFWGFTRQLKIAKTLIGLGKNNIKVILSLDKFNNIQIGEEANTLGIKTSWLYIDKDEVIPESVFVIFANHSFGKLDTELPIISRECPAVRDHSLGCNSCTKCFSFKQTFISGEKNEQSKDCYGTSP